MLRYLFPVGLFLLAFIILYSVYKTRWNLRYKQIIVTIISAILVVFLLYTCQSDNYF
ncbi:MAG TPA: hypothetical protein VJU78_16020 [Chitinophagaceae bacterium]|nr:hypothetical protein [Chitinophagaceae bacterium]